ncbi:cytosine permease [Sporolactobacillus sp. Y61]|uniref:Cytosine permease n=1 Tax=Sporolactobacillus sp. Y61 TaxID=3160863 RepID=A0AAU8IEV7_9BACL
MNNDEEILVPEKDRTISGRDLFFNWFAANIGIMGIVFGAMVVSYRLSFLQAVLASLVGALSFLIVGWVAVIGDKAGITTFKMSRAAFGLEGNKIPNGVAWINMVGWLAINIVTGTLLLVALFDVLHIPRPRFLQRSHWLCFQPVFFCPDW